MSTARQLHQLQELDLELESNEQALNQLVSQLGESQAVIKAREELVSAQQYLEKLRKQQHSTEWEIEDITTRVATDEERLYSGRITNPKELGSLQHEVNELKARRSQLEDRALETMEQTELAQASLDNKDSELKRLEAEWHKRQQQLSTDIERLKATLSDLTNERQLTSAQIDPQAVEFYHKLKKQKGIAVVRVEQGICRGCQISLPASELQRARGDSLVQCSSCGRILFLP